MARDQLLALGISPAAIKHRLSSGYLHPIHRGVYAVGHRRLDQRALWLAAVLACGDGAVLSHHSAAALWGLLRARSGPIEVTCSRGRPGRSGIALHRALLDPEDRAECGGIPATSVARTLLDLAARLDDKRLERATEEADRLRLLDRRALELACGRARGKPGVARIRALLPRLQPPSEARSPLEQEFAAFCRRQADRARDSALQSRGCRVIRITHRRLREDAGGVLCDLRRLLTAG